MKKDKNLSRQEVEYKQKSGTAWSHSYLNQKPWHPLSYPNQRRKWIAEQTHAQREQQVADVAREFAQEQEFFRQTAQMTKKEKEKMEQLQAVSFMYIRPPGYNAEAARAAEIADERKKLGLTTSSSGAPDQGAAQGNASTSGKEGAKARVKDVFGRTLPTEEEFPALKNAPRLETGAPVRLKPFAIEIRNVMCARCGAFGHQSGDRECSLKDILMPNEEDRLKREDPLNVILAQTASGEPLKWELKQQPGGLSPARGGFRPDDPNQQIIPDEDIYDEYGGFLAGEGEDEGLSIPNVLASLSKEQRRELTDPNIDVKDKKRPKKKKKKHRHGEKLDSSDEGQIRQSNRDRRRSAKHEHDLKAEPPSPLRSEDEENGMNHSNGEEQRRRHREKRRRAIRGSRRRKEESSPESDYEKKVHSSDDEDQRRKMRRDKKSVSKTDGARKRERTSDGSGDEQRRHGTHADQRGRRRRTRKHSNRSDSDNKREVYSDSSDYSPSSDEYQRRKRHLRKRRAGKREDRRKTKAFSDESYEDEDLGRKKHRDMSRVDRSDGSLKVKLSPDDGEEDQRRKFKYSDRKKLRKGDPRKTVRNERGGRKDGSSGESDDDQGMSSSDEEKRRQRRRERKMSRIESRNKR